MKISVVHVTAKEVSGPFLALFEKDLDRLCDGSVEIDHRFVPHLRRATDTVLRVPILLNTMDVLPEVVRAEEEAAPDAIMVACSGDTGGHGGQDRGHHAGGRPPRVGVAPGGDVRPVDRHLHGLGPELEGAGLQAGAGCRRRPMAAGVEGIDVPFPIAFTRGFEEPEWLTGHMTEAAEKLVEAGSAAIVIASVA